MDETLYWAKQSRVANMSWLGLGFDVQAPSHKTKSPVRSWEADRGPGWLGLGRAGIFCEKAM